MPKNLIWKRIFAFLIDIIIIEFIVNLSFNDLIKKQLNINGNFLEIYQTLSGNYQQFTSLFLFISIITAIIALIYFTIFELKMQQTLGKMIFNLKVKSVKGKLNLKQVLIRNTPKVLFFIDGLFLVLLIDLFYLIFKKERLFDKWARTTVFFKK